MGSHSTFVLIHGAWHGSWVWDAVTLRLRQAGHRVYTPTLSGLAERADELQHKVIDLSVLVEDLCQVFIGHQIEHAIVVGHSFAGLLLCALADQIPERIDKLFFLDALLLRNGQSIFDTLSPETVEKMLAKAPRIGLNLVIPPPKPEYIGYPDNLLSFAHEHMSAQPLETYRRPLELQHALGNGLKAKYLTCTEPAYSPMAESLSLAKQMGWPIIPITSSHMAPQAAPELVAQALLN